MSEGRRWSVGSYLDGYEDREVLYDVEAVLDWGGYVNVKAEESPYVFWLKGGDIYIALPHEGRAEVVFTAPRLCGNGHPLLEPVYIWRRGARLYVLDCAGGWHEFENMEQLEEWVHGLKCPEGHKKPTIHWTEWFVVTSPDRWEMVRGVGEPSPDEVISFIRRHLLPA